jgi:hypothetical protein
MALTKKDEDFCFAVGLSGVLFATICLIAHLIALSFSWQTFVMISPYFFAIISFSTLMKKQRNAPLFLLINAILLFGYLLTTIVLLLNYGVIIFSWGSILYFLFMLIVVILIYADSLPKRLKLNAMKLKEDENYWEGKI